MKESEKEKLSCDLHAIAFYISKVTGMLIERHAEIVENAAEFIKSNADFEALVALVEAPLDLCDEEYQSALCNAKSLISERQMSK